MDIKKKKKKIKSIRQAISTRGSRTAAHGMDDTVNDGTKGKVGKKGGAEYSKRRTALLRERKLMGFIKEREKKEGNERAVDTTADAAAVLRHAQRYREKEGDTHGRHAECRLARPTTPLASAPKRPRNR